MHSMLNHWLDSRLRGNDNGGVVLSQLAPAKLNLSLHITGKRADGYHLLESLVVFTDLADRLTVEAAQELSLVVRGPFATQSGDADDNLILRAARLLKQETGCARGAAITLEKHIPVGAGLGGGSSDAAAALRLLNQLWELQLSDTHLMALAPQLGADVAMFLMGRPLLATGIGEQLQPVEIPAMHAVLVYPHKPVATPEVYRRYAGETMRPAGMHAAMPHGPAFFSWLSNHTHNDLQRPAINLLADIAEILLALETNQPPPELARMTGSGACCFALYATAQQAEHAMTQLAKRFPQWWITSVAITD